MESRGAGGARSFRTYGYGEIRLPIFEPTELFARSVGLETDIVSKEMYSFEDRDDSSISLRPSADDCQNVIRERTGYLNDPLLIEGTYCIPEHSEEFPEEVVLVRFHAYSDQRRPLENNLRVA